jgi:seryl-tRNA synthetase
VSLDVNLVSSDPELVLGHLKARQSGEELYQDVARIGELREERNRLILEGDKAKALRNAVSKEIGMLMRNKDLAEGEKEAQVAALKKQVEEASVVSGQVDSKMETVDGEIKTLFSCLPNLLDDDVPLGNDESANPVVKVFREDMRKIGSEGDFMWHDDIAKVCIYIYIYI